MSRRLKSALIVWVLGPSTQLPETRGLLTRDRVCDPISACTRYGIIVLIQYYLLPSTI